LNAQAIRLVFAQVMDDVKEESRYDQKSLVGEDAFYTTLDEVIDDCRKKTG